MTSEGHDDRRGGAGSETGLGDGALMQSQDLVRALRGILVTAAVCSAGALGVALVYNDVPAKVVGSTALLAIPGLWWMVRRGQTTLASICLLGVFDALTVYALTVGGGVQDPTAMLVPVMIIASGILLNRSLALGASFVLVTSCLAVGVAELTGLVETRLSHLLSTSDVLFLAVLLLAVASLVYLMSKALRDSLHRALVTDQSYQEVFNASGEGIIVHSADTREIIDVNDSALSMFGYSAASRNDFTLDSLVGPSAEHSREKFEELLAEAGQHPSSAEWCVSHRQGTLVWVDVTLRAAVVQGHRRIVSVLRDTSERRVLQEQVQQSEKLRAVGQLARGVAHDFNNQLTVILANASLLEAGVSSDPDLAEYTTAIIESSRRSADLTQQLLAFARKGQRRDEHIDLDELVADVKALLARSIDKRIEVLHVRSAEPAMTRGDGTFLQNALLNLGLNARDAMPDGGQLRLTVESPSVVPYDSEGDDRVTVRIEDTGCGMSDEVQRHIFEPFYTTKDNGNGMGLAAVYGTVAAHDGTLTVDSAPGRGTTFTLTFPAADNPGVPAEPVPSVEVTERFAGVRVLLAEDEAGVATVAIRILRRLGCEVTHCKDGAEALDVLQNTADDFDVALLDHSMPLMTGSEVLHTIREEGHDTPVIALSGYTEASQVHHRPDAFVPKPFTLSALSDALASVLNQTS